MEHAEEPGALRPPSGGGGAGNLTRSLVQRAAAKGLIIRSCGVRGSVIRFLPPLTAPDAVVLEGLEVLEKSLNERVGA